MLVVELGRSKMKATPLVAAVFVAAALAAPISARSQVPAKHDPAYWTPEKIRKFGEIQECAVSHAKKKNRDFCEQMLLMIIDKFGSPPVPMVDNGRPTAVIEDHSGQVVPNVEGLLIWRGSMDGPPCTTLEWPNSGVFGTPSPTLTMSAQRFEASVRAELHGAPAIRDRIRQDVLDCGATAGAAGVLVAAKIGKEGGLATFKAAFDTCLATKAAQVARHVGNLSIETGSKCTN